LTLADCGKQQSSSEWIREAVPEVKALRLDNPDVILNELPQFNAGTDDVVADGPGSHTETSRALLLLADLAILTCKASMLEVGALAKATEVLRVSPDIRAGLPKAVIVLGMVGKNYRLTADMKDAAAALNPLARFPRRGTFDLERLYPERKKRAARRAGSPYDAASNGKGFPNPFQVPRHSVERALSKSGIKSLFAS
jgi:hypothetical protein